MRSLADGTTWFNTPRTANVPFSNCSALLTQVPQDLRLLERTEAHWKVAVLLDEEINPGLAATFFRKKPEGLPFLWLSQLIMTTRSAECRFKFRQLMTLVPPHVPGPTAQPQVAPVI
jgi:hypothetical protein